jgi:hypothetical protein
MDIPTRFIWIVILFDEAFNYGNGAKFLDHAGTNAKSLCVEFCSFLQCHILVIYLNVSVRLCVCVPLITFVQKCLEVITSLLNNLRKVGG